MKQKKTITFSNTASITAQNIILPLDSLLVIEEGANITVNNEKVDTTNEIKIYIGTPNHDLSPTCRLAGHNHDDDFSSDHSAILV